MPVRDMQSVLVVHAKIGGLAGPDRYLLAVDGELERPVERDEHAFGVEVMVKRRHGVLRVKLRECDDPAHPIPPRPAALRSLQARLGRTRLHPGSMLARRTRCQNSGGQAAAGRGHAAVGPSSFSKMCFLSLGTVIATTSPLRRLAASK
jgi:hypothetical protein